MLQDLTSKDLEPVEARRKGVRTYLGGSQSTLRTGLEHPENEISGRWRQAVQSLRLDSVLQDVATGFLVVCPFEGTATDQHSVEDAAQRPDVDGLKHSTSGGCGVRRSGCTMV